MGCSKPKVNKSTRSGGSFGFLMALGRFVIRLDFSGFGSALAGFAPPKVVRDRFRHTSETRISSQLQSSSRKPFAPVLVEPQLRATPRQYAKPLLSPAEESTSNSSFSSLRVEAVGRTLAAPSAVANVGRDGGGASAPPGKASPTPDSALLSKKDPTWCTKQLGETGTEQERELTPCPPRHAASTHITL